MKKNEKTKTLSRDFNKKNELSIKDVKNSERKNPLTSQITSKLQQKDQKWDATITSKPKSKTPAENKANISNNSNENKLQSSMKNLKNPNDSLHSLKDSHHNRTGNLAESKLLSNSSNQSKKEENDSKNSSKISDKDKISVNSSKLFMNPNAKLNGNNNKNDISAISYQYFLLL